MYVAAVTYSMYVQEVRRSESFSSSNYRELGLFTVLFYFAQCCIGGPKGEDTSGLLQGRILRYKIYNKGEET